MAKIKKVNEKERVFVEIVAHPRHDTKTLAEKHVSLINDLLKEHNDRHLDTQGGSIISKWETDGVPTGRSTGYNVALFSKKHRHVLLRTLNTTDNVIIESAIGMYTIENSSAIIIPGEVQYCSVSWAPVTYFYKIIMNIQNYAPYRPAPTNAEPLNREPGRVPYNARVCEYQLDKSSEKLINVKCDPYLDRVVVCIVSKKKNLLHLTRYIYYKEQWQPKDPQRLSLTKILPLKTIPGAHGIFYKGKNGPEEKILSVMGGCVYEVQYGQWIGLLEENIYACQYKNTCILVGRNKLNHLLVVTLSPDKFPQIRKIDNDTGRGVEVVGLLSGILLFRDDEEGLFELDLKELFPCLQKNLNHKRNMGSYSDVRVITHGPTEEEEEEEEGEDNLF